MNHRSLLVASGVLVVTSLPFSCGGGDTGGGGSTSSATATASATHGVTATHASVTSGPADCTGLGEPLGAECAACLEANCCAELAMAGPTFNDPDLTACAAASCTVCLQTEPPFPLQCTLPTSPFDGSCVTIGGAVHCNPVTNEGCPTAGAACDINIQNHTFECYTTGNDHDLCEYCGINGDYCKAGSACLGKCARYCCADIDCAPGHCEKIDPATNGDLFSAPGLGVCAMGPSMTTSSSSSGGGGASGGAGGAGG